MFRRTVKLPEIIRGPLAPARKALKPLPQLGETGAHRMLLFAADHQILPVDARIAASASGSIRRRRRRLPKRRGRCSRRDAGVAPDTGTFRRAFLLLAPGAATHRDDPHCVICPLLKDCPGKNAPSHQP
jgi:hypothetical protein